MKQKKYTLRPLELWASGAIEKWLEDEAAKGWRLTDCGSVLAVFTAMEPGEYRVRLQPQRSETPEARRGRAAAYREMGWDCTAVICDGDQAFDVEVYYCGDPSAPELDTDPVARGWAWEKPLRRSWRVAWVALGVLVALPVLLTALSNRSALDYLLNENLFWLLWLAGLYLLGIVMLRRLWYLRRMRRQLAAGMVPDPGNWRRDRRWQQTVIVLFLVCWGMRLACIAAPLWRTEPDVASLPYTAPTALAEGTDKEYWEFEIDNYVYRSTALAPARSGSQFRGRQGEVVRNAADRLRFTFLAKALYRERAADFQRDHPDAAETAVEYDAFDEALLLAEGDERLFLARKGTVVYALWVDFPVNLSGSIEHAAASLAAPQ